MAEEAEAQVSTDTASNRAVFAASARRIPVALHVRLSIRDGSQRALHFPPRDARENDSYTSEEHLDYFKGFYEKQTLRTGMCDSRMIP